MSANVSRIQVILDGAQATTQAKALNTEMDNIGKTAQRAGVGGAQGLTQLERSIAATRQASAQLRLAIADNRIEITNLTTAMKVLEDQGRKNSAEYANLAARLNAVSTETRRLVAEQGALGAETGVLTTSKQALKTQIDSNTGAFDKMTTRISVGRGILGGYDQAVEGVVRAMGGITVGWAVAIGLASALLPKIIELATAKQKLIEIDEKQVAVDIVSAQLGGNVSRVNADVLTSTRNIISAREDYTKATEGLDRALRNIESGQQAVTLAVTQGGIAQHSTADKTKELQQAAAEYNKTLGDQDKAMKPAIESLRLIQRSYGLNEEGLRSLGERYRIFGKTQEEITENQKFFHQQIEADLPGLEALASALAKDTDRMYDLRRAALETAIAIQQIKPPNLNLGAFANPQDANDRLRQAAATAVVGGDEAGRPLKTDLEIFNAIRPVLEAVRKSFLDTAAALGKNQAETKALYNSYVSQLDPMYQQWIARLATVAKNERVFTDEKNEGAKAAREILRNEDAMFQLRKELIDSEQKLGKFNFEIQRELIHQEFAERRKVAHDQAVARHATVADIKAIDGILIELERNMITLNKTAEVDYTIKLKEEYNKRLKAGRDFRAAEQKDFLAFMVKQRQDREKMQAEAIAAQDKLDHIARLDRPGRKTAEVEQMAADAEAIARIRVGFDQANQAGRAFDEMIKNIALDGAAGFNGIGGAVRGLANDIFNVANIANALGNAIGSAFEAAISGTDSFGHSLVKAVLNFIATIAQQFGALFILIGSGLIWLGWPGGGALIGYGIALEALAGVLRGVAAKIGQDNPQQAVSTATSGGSASNTGRPEPTARVIAFPTSASSGGPNGGMSLKLDRAGTKDFLEGREVVTVGDLHGRGANSSVVSKRIKKMAS